MSTGQTAATRSRDEIASAIRLLTAADWARLKLVAGKYAAGRPIESDDLLQEAMQRAIDGRVCPAHVDVVKFLAEAMRSIAHGETEKAEHKLVLVPVAKTGDYAAEALAVADPMTSVEERIMSEQNAAALTVKVLAEAFTASRTATAIRLVEIDYAPSLLVCHGPKGRKWFTRAPSVPSKWFPQNSLDAESFAFGVLFGKKPDDPIPRKIGADAWFDRREAQRFEVQEQTFRTGSDEVLTLVSISDAGMLEEDEARGWRPR